MRVGFMVASCPTLAGIISALAIGASRPARTSSSNTLVERRGVGAAGLDHRLDVLDVRVELAGREPGLVALHPVDVAADAC